MEKLICRDQILEFEGKKYKVIQDAYPAYRSDVPNPDDWAVMTVKNNIGEHFHAWLEQLPNTEDREEMDEQFNFKKPNFIEKI